ncbi:hypothetical protein LEP1GSC064_3228 [Leptospira kirschneri serovar Grippotyphosa str. Moskva]|uniref:Uncharacterized protein n=1 Tax=Leptospira kirschneri str. 200802841 TaxID=1193047 RepID=A0A828Y431_9LEPT|nr:hypothetical protein LEP1GSC044_1191 [Leptospira kirschneri serovar Grippotyphosa str. RM52]EKO52538.1 hypothetical protein LEP1GSC131_4380 [Leptospira kirschneri str. 200802841]EKQ82999.1 hypothetical protein LEP1GSC064_3228 [Leptospira kirschneri serovar Grippotyphosa str. Moskva]EKR09589.1 hypothetical protein LEP1GSC122_1787 [Leptospira kirschneri serovar Valbuzzi str. 200702274]EMK02672.1 hypothetical protein LEP1GSC176_1131 [Leptospira kirschneri str. MMD1493]
MSKQFFEHVRKYLMKLLRLLEYQYFVFKRVYDKFANLYF